MEKATRKEIVTFDLTGLSQEEFVLIKTGLQEYQGRVYEELNRLNTLDPSDWTSQYDTVLQFWEQDKVRVTELLNQLDSVR